MNQTAESRAAETITASASPAATSARTVSSASRCVVSSRPAPSPTAASTWPRSRLVSHVDTRGAGMRAAEAARYGALCSALDASRRASSRTVRSALHRRRSAASRALA